MKIQMKNTIVALVCLMTFTFSCTDDFIDLQKNPNAFTPDNDGINDGFGPQGINITNLDFYVFNRWGEQIFHSISMDDKWDGKVNGNIVPVDVYIWKIFYRTEEDYGGLKSRQKVGTVTVLR